LGDGLIRVALFFLILICPADSGQYNYYNIST